MTRTQSMARSGPVARAALVVVAALAAVTAVSGCQPNETGAAAVVGDARISEAQVSSAAEGAVAAVAAVPNGTTQAQDESRLLRTNLSRLVAHELIAVAAAEEGVTVSQTEVDKLIDTARSGASSAAAFEADVAAQSGVPPYDIESFARDYLLRRAIGQKLAPTGDAAAQDDAATAKLAQVADEVGVTISPRYGTWDAATVSLTAEGTDTLSRPASPSPSAGLG